MLSSFQISILCCFVCLRPDILCSLQHSQAPPIWVVISLPINGLKLRINILLDDWWRIGNALCLHPVRFYTQYTYRFYICRSFTMHLKNLLSNSTQHPLDFYAHTHTCMRQAVLHSQGIGWPGTREGESHIKFNEVKLT